MAMCTFCDREMTSASSCGVGELHQDNVAVAMIPWGRESRWRRPKRGQRCGDCGVLPGGFHHLGCDIAECPRCGRQQLSCECRYDEDPPDPEDELDDDL
jgi:hypothetical protein